MISAVRKNDTLGEITFDISFVSVANTFLLMKKIALSYIENLVFGGVHIFFIFYKSRVGVYSNSVG